MIVHAVDEGEVFSRWLEAVGLRQPEVNVETRNKVGRQLMKKHVVEPEGVHNHWIKGKAKSGGEEVVKDDDLIFLQMGRGLASLRGASLVGSNLPSANHLGEDGFGHATLTEEPGWGLRTICL